MATKKSVKFALKYALGSEEMRCGTCREELASFLKDTGLAMRERKEQGFTIVVKDGHMTYKEVADKHSGPPAPKEKKSKKAEGEIEEEEA